MVPGSTYTEMPGSAKASAVYLVASSVQAASRYRPTRSPASLVPRMNGVVEPSGLAGDVPAKVGTGIGYRFVYETDAVEHSEVSPNWFCARA